MTADKISFKRLFNSIKADMLFQLKEGFIYVILIVALLYIFILKSIPHDAANKIIPIIIFSDPSELGLFFIGGIILLEKQQGIISLLYITSFTIKEYIISKTFTLGIVSLVPCILISLFIAGSSVNYLLLTAGVLLTSIFFTQIGILVSIKCLSVTDYVIKIIPPMILLCIPCVFIYTNNLLPESLKIAISIISSVAGLKIINASFFGSGILEIIISFISLLTANIYLLSKVSKAFDSSLVEEV